MKTPSEAERHRKHREAAEAEKRRLEGGRHYRSCDTRKGGKCSCAQLRAEVASAMFADEEDRADEEDGDLGRKDYRDWPSSFWGNGWKRMGGEL